MSQLVINSLTNKIPLLFAPISGANTVTILIMVKTGSKYESRNLNGLSHFIEHMLFKGTKKLSTALDISSALDSLGSEYNAFTAKEYTGYWIKVAKAKSNSALEIIADMLLNSKFLSTEINRERGVIIEELNMYQNNPMMYIEDVFEECLYGDTPAGWDTIGTKDNILSFSRQDFLNYYQQQYGTQSFFIVLAGAVDDKNIRQVQRLFSKTRVNNWQDKVKVLEKQTSPQIKIVNKKVDQINLSLGVRAYPAGHPHEYVAKLLAIILGGSMSSRLFVNLREKHGLAYYVRTNSEAYTDTGYLTTQAGVPINKSQEAVKIIMTEYRRLKNSKISATELKRTKEMWKGRFLLRLETSDELANWYGRQLILQSKIISPSEFLKRIDRITALELQETARHIFKDESLNLALIGQTKASDYKSLLKF